MGKCKMDFYVSLHWMHSSLFRFFSDTSECCVTRTFFFVFPISSQRENKKKVFYVIMHLIKSSDDALLQKELSLSRIFFILSLEKKCTNEIRAETHKAKFEGRGKNLFGAFCAFIYTRDIICQHLLFHWWYEPLPWTDECFWCT